MKKFIFLVCALCMCVFALSACDDEELPPPAEEYSVSYADGLADVELAVPDSASYTEGETVTVQAGLSANGYAFAGWSDGETLYQPAETFQMPAHDVTLTAQWKQMYGVSYADGLADIELAVPDSVSYAEGETVTLKAGLSANGYAFAGWSDGETLYQPAETFQMPAHDVTLTAQWVSLPGVWNSAVQYDPETAVPSQIVIAEREGTTYFTMFTDWPSGSPGSSGVVRKTPTGYDLVYYDFHETEQIISATFTAAGLTISEGEYSLLYPTENKTPMPENAQFPAKLYNAEKGFTLDFTAKRFTAATPSVDITVEFVYLGDYVLIGRREGDVTRYSTLYKDGDDYFIWDAVWWQSPTDSGRLELTGSEPAPQSSPVGVWTGTSESTVGEAVTTYPTSLYIAESGGKLYFVMVITDDDRKYVGGTVTEEGGAYRFSLGSVILPESQGVSPEITFALTLDGNTLTGNFTGAIRLERAQGQAPAPLQLSGTYSGTFEDYTATVDFTAKTWNGADADFIAVGDFVLVASKTAQEYLIVFKSADKYYFANYMHMQGYYSELTAQN